MEQKVLTLEVLKDTESNKLSVDLNLHDKASQEDALKILISICDRILEENGANYHIEIVENDKE